MGGTKTSIYTQADNIACLQGQNCTSQLFKSELGSKTADQFDIYIRPDAYPYARGSLSLFGIALEFTLHPRPEPIWLGVGLELRLGLGPRD